MDKKSELDKNLSKMEPEVKQLSEFLTEFNKESDRGAVLIAAAVLDDKLGEILGAFFANVPENEELLNGFNAPLGTFSAKISAAYCMGLIQENEFHEINIIRRIRNEFGHSWKNVDFHTSKIVELCNQLPWLGPEKFKTNSNSRERFNFELAILLSDLLWRTRLVRKVKCKIRNWPNTSR